MMRAVLCTAWAHGARAVAGRLSGARWGAPCLLRRLSAVSPSQPPPPSVVIVGAGFGGLNAALTLSSMRWPPGRRPSITLVDAGERFVFKPLLYELVTGEARVEDVAPRLSDVLAQHGEPLALVHGRVTAVQWADSREASGLAEAVAAPAADPRQEQARKQTCSPRPPKGTVLLEDGRELTCDCLVMAQGSAPSRSPPLGVADLALALETPADALALRQALLAARALPRPRVAVVGGGYAGVEAAAVAAEVLAGGGGPLAAIALLSSEAAVLSAAMPEQRRVAEEALLARGVAFRGGVLVKSVGRVGGEGGSREEMSVRFVDSERPSEEGALEADLVIWAAGPLHAPEAPAQLPFARDAAGRLRVEETLEILGASGAFALGDAASLPSHAAASAQLARQEAQTCAENVWAHVAGRGAPKPFRYAKLGEMMTLGGGEGAVSFETPLPLPLAHVLARQDVLGAGLRLLGAHVFASEEPGGKGGAPDERPPPPPRLSLTGPLGGLVRRAAYALHQPTAQMRAQVASQFVRGEVRRWARAWEQGGRGRRRG